MDDPKIIPELAELTKPYTLPASDPYSLQTQMGSGVPGVVDTQKIDVKALGKLGSQERLQNIRQQEADLRQQELQAKQRVSEGQQKIAEIKSTGQAAITSQEAERAKGIYQSVEGFREKNPAPELTPTKDNIQSLSTLFGLIGVIGMAMGGSGKQSATASLNAMGGMMKGWQQGRADLWKKEVQEFDKNMLSWKSKLDDAMKKAEAAYKILPYNRAEAESKLNEVLTSMGSALLKEQNRVQGFEPTFKNLESLAKDADSAIKESGVERRHRETIDARAAEKTAKITQQQQMAQRAVNSLGGVASALESIKELPAGTTTGLLPNLQTKDGLLNYVRNTIGRKVTKREAEEMNTIFTGIGRNLASIEASGAATGLSELSKQMQSGLYINSGTDDPYKVAIKLADIKRIAVENILPAIDSGTLTPGQAESARGLINRINQAIPFTTIEVIQAGRQSGKPTIGDVTTQAVEKGRLNQEKEKRLRELEAREKEQ
jgi:hypothetical protein